ncbi:YscQ/HrcQ family type III secretion apparatus protein [Lysobacteraceae bacterium NML93-0792]|nr:YscQ/HrcQ family type III secretion apparatus protein [Xanthomonadaceae bacterium NML93-0792]PBS15022.1 YscQ/HrcQ family type III secretion apparatus protein [Xanthomonadaceae bacterium NML93-0793]PBS17887.1 YscQ/HrcQ family type III secretion apparatus protein [Xanthomonadaceae bacterium NML93-0831]
MDTADTHAHAVSPLRGRIPHLASTHAATLREMHRRPRRWANAGDVLTLRGGCALAPDALFELDADGVRLGVQFIAPPATPDDDALQWQDHQGRARVLAWSLAHESALLRLSTALGTSLVPVTDTDAPPADDAAVWLLFELAPDDDADQAPVLHGSLRVPSCWIDAFLARHPGDGPAVDPGAWRQLPARGSIALAAPPLSRGELRGLRPGDVIVVGSTRTPPVHVDIAGRRWPVRASGEGWRVDGPSHSRPRFQETAPMSDTDTPDQAGADAPPTADPTAELPVEVAFELGTVELRLGDLAGLQPGYVFGLPAHLEGANVTIRANGRVAGRGELVAVGETLGVRLIGWS